MNTSGSVPEDVEFVLVPLDGSDFSWRAVPVAARLAGKLDAGIVLFSAVGAVEDVPAREAELAAVVPPCLGPVHRSVVVSLDPAGAIHEHLRQLGRDRALACMASHGRARSAALMGSVATEVVARGHDPLVVVGPHPDEHPGGHGVMVAVDETPASAALLPIGVGWAALLGEPLTVTTVAEPVPPPLRPDHPTRRRFGPDADVDAFLEGLVGPLHQQGHKVDALPLYDPISPASGLELHLRDNPATMVVVASHARTGPTRIVFGSDSASIVRRSPSPVLVVPRPDAR
ncbi:MAG TPA: universal stress protein [Acidimicrobiia bacterium]|nr:universal stress protein [Acidimicrobiia bacterium]